MVGGRTGAFSKYHQPILKVVELVQARLVIFGLLLAKLSSLLSQQFEKKLHGWKQAERRENNAAAANEDYTKYSDNA